VSALTEALCRLHAAADTQHNEVLTWEQARAVLDELERSRVIKVEISDDAGDWFVHAAMRSAAARVLRTAAAYQRQVAGVCRENHQFQAEVARRYAADDLDTRADRIEQATGDLNAVLDE
jgi:hypothetical protein